ncbi:MAG: hypothetical protein HFG95_10890 [Dorea sp.]|jgi:hypothetical protein|nr:hypothetical protein [Dorea sp.]
MKIIRKYKKVAAMSAAALGLVAALTIESSMAYFTTYVSAEGGHVVNIGARTEIQEEVSEMTKHITLLNTSDRGDCFVRLMVFYGAGVSVTYSDVEGKGDWYDGGDGYWYYRPILPMGEKTSQLDVSIDTTGLVKPGTDPNTAAEYIKDKFNVVVVQECTPVLYDDDGKAYANWETVYTDYQKASGEGDGN